MARPSPGPAPAAQAECRLRCPGCTPCILLLGVEGGRSASSWVDRACVRGPAPSTQGAGQSSTLRLRLPSRVHARRPAGSQALLAWRACCSWGRPRACMHHHACMMNFLLLFITPGPLAGPPSAARPRAPHLAHTRAPPALPWLGARRASCCWVHRGTVGLIPGLIVHVSGDLRPRPTGCGPAVHPPAPLQGARASPQGWAAFCSRIMCCSESESEAPVDRPSSARGRRGRAAGILCARAPPDSSDARLEAGHRLAWLPTKAATPRRDADPLARTPEAAELHTRHTRRPPRSARCGRSSAEGGFSGRTRHRGAAQARDHAFEGQSSS
jgi:hypothetical protein